MSRGLGSIEREIIEFLINRVSKWDSYIEGRNEKYKTGSVYLGGEASTLEVISHTKKNYKAILNSIKSLEKKGFITKRKITTKTAKTNFEKNAIKKSKSNWIVIIKLTKKIFKKVPREYEEIYKTTYENGNFALECISRPKIKDFVFKR
jgi:predicted transcriptional regulator